MTAVELWGNCHIQDTCEWQNQQDLPMDWMWRGKEKNKIKKTEVLLLSKNLGYYSKRYENILRVLR